MAATGKLSKPVDFALIPAKEDANFSALFLETRKLIRWMSWSFSKKV
ncbi:hypothetical protein HMPREF0765_3160 [Sphingobacterium spiritivorum ATCC 33300]|uniref:Uncharacterized protein n=1 Tax=Sphingobacterium spiritivorum ATCC 33300 TaxID=525372 RepID=C2G0Q4_SPHSI|nr:hypothetical protein HMPREF0765_3160 [Sphingobacterium spiritivorum ATCC 33300]